ncbi:MAG TPA: hypothetical protein VLK36_17230 [Gaiellaceae bacterium]|nr:hypothetical protein [Gaiellaceae bacterium]
MDALHHRQRGLALVEALDDRRAEAHQLPAEPVGAGLRAGLDQVERLEAAEQPVGRRARLVDQLRQPARRRLALLGQLLEQEDSLGECADRVLADLLLAFRECQLEDLLFRILDRLSA